MRRTAWILAALGLAGSSLRGYGQESPRANVSVRRTPPAATSTADKEFYDDLFGAPPKGEPQSDARPVAKSLSDSMRSSKSLEELVSGSNDDGLPTPSLPGDAFPTSRATSRGSDQAVTAAALFEASDRPTGVKKSSAKGAVLKADPVTAIPEAGDVVPVAGTGRTVATSLQNRNQRVIPSENTGAPTNVDQHLLMIGELPVDPLAPAMPPKSNGRVQTTAGSELPELDFSNATEEPAPQPEFDVVEEPAPAQKPNVPVIRKRPAGVAPKYDLEKEAPNWEDEEGDAELLDNPFAQYRRDVPPIEIGADMPAMPQSEPAFDEPALDETAPASPLMRRPAMPAAAGPAAEKPAPRTMRNPSNPLAPRVNSRSMTIPSVRQPAMASEPAEAPVTDFGATSSLADPMAEAPRMPPAKAPVQAPVKTVRRTPEPEPSLTDLLADEPAIKAAPPMASMPATAPPVAVAHAPRREQFITSTPERNASAGVTARWVKKSEIAIGQECECELVVQNTMDTAVSEVEVEAYFPANVQLVGTTPMPQRSQASLVWTFSSLSAGESKTISIRMVPRERGSIATQAYVRFANAASGTFNVAEPMLAVELAGPNEVMIGETASHTVTIRNPGTGTASNVRVEARIPDGLEHSRGSRLMLELGALNPGESRPVRLALAAVQGGRHVIQVKAHADGDITQVAASEVTVVAPKLKADIQGPGLRYLGRRAVYTLSVTNDGSANTDNVRVMHKIPEGFEFISADSGATYSSSNRMLSWFVGSMNTGDVAQAHVTLEAREAGPATHFIRATSEHGVVSDAQVTTQVEGAASLVVEITDLDDPVEVGVETGYEIRVKNEGTAPAESVALTCELPMGARFVSAAGAVNHAVRGQLVEFRPVGRVAPGETVKYQVLMRGENAGNLRFRTHLTSSSITDPLTSEELTKFYGE